MSPIETFQDLLAQVPEFVQPLVVALAAAVPFIEGEGAAAIGIVGGIHPVIAVLGAIVGNFACVTVLVLLSAGARDAVVSRSRARTRARETVTVAAGTSMASASEPVEHEAAVPRSPRAEKFARSFERYGLPGVSLLGPLLMPTQFTATMLAAAGIGRARILIWQAVAIVVWTVAVAMVVSGVTNLAH